MKVPPVNIYAFTALDHPYPPYISVNDGNGDTVSVTVRSQSTQGPGCPGYPTCGAVAETEIPREEARAMALAILKATDG